MPCASCKKECLAELLGTYLLVFVGPGSVIVASLLHMAALESLAFVAAVFGGTVAAVILVLGRFSGAHINPAVTVASMAGGQLRRGLFVPYILFQLVGGLAAGLSLRLGFGATDLGANLGSTSLASGVSPVEGV
ncbi:MAG TPA: aquaporin, partial [Nitrososphaerales archaeon]|nr:aquaporin [Nitrososphaerales archaeon]